VAKRSKNAVHFYLEDGFLVRGTLDPQEALKLAVAHDDDFTERYWAAEEAGRMTDEPDENPNPDAITALANTCHELLADARPGLYRIVPAPRDDDEYTWFCRPASTRGPGVFEAVSFQ
jgi:hypothetical protein